MGGEGPIYAAHLTIQSSQETTHTYCSREGPVQELASTMIILSVDAPNPSLIDPPNTVQSWNF
jgi:hypothetical protein